VLSGASASLTQIHVTDQHSRPQPVLAIREETTRPASLRKSLSVKTFKTAPALRFGDSIGLPKRPAATSRPPGTRGTQLPLRTHHVQNEHSFPIVAVADATPACPLDRTTMHEPWVSLEWHRHTAAIRQIDRQRIAADVHRLRVGRPEFNP